MKPCAVNSIRLVQWRKSRPPIFDRTPGPRAPRETLQLARCRGGFRHAAVAAAQSHRMGRRILHRGCTGNAERGGQRSCVICVSRREGSVRHWYGKRRWDQLNPNSCCRSLCPAGRRLSDRDQTLEALSELFQDWQSTPTRSSVTVLRDLRQRMDVRFGEGRNHRPTIFFRCARRKQTAGV